MVYQPLKDEVYWAEKGQGAFSSSQRGRLRVSARTKMAECLMGTGAPFLGHGDAEKFANELKAVTEVTAGVRRFGSAALDFAYVAAGRFDAFWEMSLSPWDVAAGLLLVREAGGYVIDYTGKPATPYSKDYIAGNASTYLELKGILDRSNPVAPHVKKAAL
jgi:myo-inositol-1(or 4)-monophosphatase